MRRLTAVGVAAVLAVWTSGAEAFVLAEHIRITARALGRLGGHAGALRAAWATFASRDRHLCPDLAAPANGDLDAPWCVGLSALPALAADHACSPKGLGATLAKESWVLDVMKLAARSEADLVKARGSIARTLDARRDQHLRLQILDPDYVPRARDNDVHFQLARSVCRPGRDSLGDYLVAVTAPGQLANATASYVHYHAIALALARSTAPAAAELAILNEAFALHFLEDAFSAGHFVGLGNDEAEKLGTHDYYSQNGVDALTWAGERYAAHGDAFLDDAETERVASAVATSLADLAEAFAGTPPREEDDPITNVSLASTDFDVCKATAVPDDAAAVALSPSLVHVLRYEPIPATETPELPRFRTELGVSAGPSATLDGLAITGVDQATPGFIAGRARIGARIGLGVTDLLTRSEDGNVFVEAILHGERGHDGSRSGLGIRVHVPFAYVPFDGIVFAPCALFAHVPACVTASRRAAAGSLYRINPSRRFTQFASGGITILRDVALLFSNEDGPGSPTRRDLLLSVANLRTGTDYAGRIATHIGVELGFQWRHEYRPTEIHLVGGYLSLFTDTPYYVYP